ncbi:MAG TPA: hypothetical protein DD438_01510 [Verrucomicrobiales bacterium]|nr:hypothetical protein [Verrucomicrobiales bacterium]
MFFERVAIRFLLLQVLIFAVLPVSAESEPEGEKPRIWTSVDGRKLTGTLEEKGEDWVKIKIRGKVYNLKLEKLSKKDQDYLKTHKIRKPLEIRTELKSYKDNDLKRTVMTLDVEFANMEENSELYLLLVWISKKKSELTSGSVSIKEKLECFYDRDGVYSHEAGFYDDKNGDDFRGWAIRVMDTKGTVIAERASASSYLRYLETVVTRSAPVPPEEEK